MEVGEVLSIAGNKLAYDGYLAAEQDRLIKERR